MITHKRIKAKAVIDHLRARQSGFDSFSIQLQFPIDGVVKGLFEDDELEFSTYFFIFRTQEGNLIILR